MSTSSNSSNNQPQQTSPFGGRFGSSSSSSSRFGSSSQRNSSSSSSRFGFSRFARQSIQWTVKPLGETAVRFSLDGLGDPFHRLLGKPLNVDFGEIDKVIAALEADADLKAELETKLNDAWESYNFEGAALLYPIESSIQQAYTQAIHPLPESDDDTDDSDDNQQQAAADSYTSPYTCLRAIDLAFVLNVLARVRANVVVANTPLALERGFLTQSFICDDDRIANIARATGCIGEKW